ncbi:hypothetical protein FC34_GL001331 [Lacticaseibacillus brantae DSM 23927]|uniref:Uncharacterized protein n=2 Tax=Lacticaseibacillus brantae TaxID=943673 RepID=A0A0R2AY59_9LACO|nr:hypothetical protein FC34_GL001331 [Lacticaseibacillus brantae DSM 23927]
MVNADVSDNYDPFLGGFVVAPPENISVRERTNFTVSALVLPAYGRSGGQSFQYLWQWRGQTFPGSTVNLSPGDAGTYPLSVAVRQGSQTLYRRAFTVTVIKGYVPGAKVIEPESQFAFPGFPLMVRFQSGADFTVPYQSLNQAKGYYDLFTGLFFPTPQAIRWQDVNNNPGPVVAVMDFDWMLPPIRASMYFGGVRPVMTSDSTVTLTVHGVPAHAPGTTVTYRWWHYPAQSKGYQLLATTMDPSVTVATSALQTGSYQVQVVYTRAGQSVSMLSGHAPLSVNPPQTASAIARILGLADFVIPPHAQVQVHIAPFQVAKQPVPLQIQFGHKIITADGSWQALLPEDLHQQPQVLLPKQAQLPPGHYQSQLTILLAQIPENGTDF